MRTVIYLDVLLLTNGWIAVLLLAGCAVLCGQQLHWLRLCLAGCVAAGCSLLLLLPRLPFAIQLACQAAGAAAIVGTAFPWRGMRVFLRQQSWYVLMNLVLAGVVSGWCIRGSQWMETNNLTCYFQISPGVLAGSSLGIYLLLTGLRAGFGGLKTFVPLTVQGRDWSVELSGYCDTGLTAVDALTGRDILLVHYPSVQNRLPPALATALAQMLAGQPPAEGWSLRYVSCDTVAGQVLLPALSVTVTADGARQEMTAAFTAERPGDARCEALFGQELGGKLTQKHSEIQTYRGNLHEKHKHLANDPALAAAFALRQRDPLYHQHPDLAAAAERRGGEGGVQPPAAGGLRGPELSGGTQSASGGIHCEKI